VLATHPDVHLMSTEMFKSPTLANLPLDNEQITITHLEICPLFDAGKNRTFDTQEVRYLRSCGLTAYHWATAQAIDIHMA